MNDKLEKTLKELLPYIIITGIIFLLLPLFMGTREGAMTYIIELGAFPLTAIGCGVFYKYKNHKNNLPLCAVAPLFYVLSALLYGMWRTSWYTVLIYIVAYTLCGYLGQMLGDLLSTGKKSADSSNGTKRSIKMPSLRPKRVNVEEDNLPAESFKAEDPEEDMSLDTSTTEDDIEAILNSIHNRKS